MRVRTGAEAEDQADRVDQPSVAGFEPSVRAASPGTPGFVARQPRAGMTEVRSTGRPQQSPATAMWQCSATVLMGNA